MGFVRLASVAAIVVLFASTGFAHSIVSQPVEGSSGHSNAVANATPAEAAKPETAVQAGHQASDAELPAASEDNSDAAAVEPLPPPEPTLFADIDLTRQVMTVSDTSGEIGQWKISSARSGYSTPTGTYTPSWSTRMHYSRQYDWAPMPYAVFFTNGVAVHATNAIGNLGQPASHGCVRLHPKNAKTFYNLVQKHGEPLTRIVVHGKPPYSAAVADGSRRRYQRYQPYGFFAAQPYYGQRSYRRQRYGGGYNTW
jgi:lipoprotein-anchoring transpeptidase ErfK/SrfK